MWQWRFGRITIAVSFGRWLGAHVALRIDKTWFAIGATYCGQPFIETWRVSPKRRTISFMCYPRLDL